MRRYALVLSLILTLGLAGCAKPPVELDPQAALAFQATRVVKALDVLRDAAIAGHDMTPPLLTTNDTREVVSWHKTVVQVIQVTPTGWKSIVRESLYVATCDPRVALPPRATPDPNCQPRLPATVLIKLAPYVSVIVLVVQEVL